MKNLRYKFQFALFILIVIVFLGLGLLLGQLFKNYYIESFHSEFRKQGQLIVTQIEESGGLNEFNEDSIQRIQSIVEGNITILDPNGNVIFDNRSDQDMYEQNEEVILQIAEKIEKETSGINYVGRGDDMTYYWEVIETDGESDGVLILSTSINALEKASKNIWLLLSIILGIAFVIILFISSRIITSFTKPVDSAIKTAIELAKGNYNARTYEDYNSEISFLNSSLNILARNLQKITKEQEMQADRLFTVIENMGIPFILIDDKGFITLTNHTYNDVFRVDSNKQIINKTYLDVIEHDEVKELIEDVFMTEQKIRRQIRIPINIHLKNFEVYGAPIISYHNEWKGIVVVFHDITEIKKLEKIRKDFVANVSHELKTPITSIKGFTETLLDGAMENKETLEYFLNIVFKESNRLQSLTNDLLELSRIEQDGFRLDLSVFNLTPIVKEIVETLENKAHNKGIHLKFLAAKDHVIEADQSWISQVLINLVSNAISYTPPGGEVKIDMEEDEMFVSVHVTDTGIGIDKEEIPRIFERFYRVDKARSRNSGGTGLGLAIVKHLVEAHQGEIMVESELGKGSTFTVKLQKVLSK